MDELDDKEILTQFAGRTQPAAPLHPFRNMVLTDSLAPVTLITGHRTPDEAAHLVCGRPGRFGDVVRHTRVGLLREAEFLVRPTPAIRFPEHVSVVLARSWTKEDARRFDGCFGPITWWKEKEEERDA
ncbi:hypothetical protein [Rhizohabitans arisaemae]|uniref:hypothetical protein n=1 Tax=Rhizohabitans arisaemae TaxID=2720610 RepID=UPI0024B1AD5E|nr:hypothetical protein [Rhizohabitans arisaemae]